MQKFLKKKFWEKKNLGKKLETNILGKKFWKKKLKQKFWEKILKKNVHDWNTVEITRSKFANNEVYLCTEQI